MEHINETLEGLLLNESLVNNVTENFNDVAESDYHLPQWILNFYFGFICLGCAVDLIFVSALIRSKRSGTLSLVLQISAVDAISPFIAAIEILTLNNHTWIFSHNTCLIYNGLEILINSLTLWLIICLNFHVISLWNMHKSNTAKKNTNPLTSCGDESNECLVTNREHSSNRILNIDYRKRKNDVAIVIPTILIWFFCISLSIPNFTLSSILKMKQQHTICAIIDNFYGYILQILLLVFKVLLPIPLILFSLIVSIIKLTKTSLKDIDTMLTKDFVEIRDLLIFCIALTILYLATSFQRNLFHFLHINSHSFSTNSSEIFKVPPLYNNQLSAWNNMSLTMLHYSCNMLRALLCLCMLPKFRGLIKNRIFFCSTKD
ncbi:unnamed protein product [Phaedon cochleariae]|uniref:G-protein coupled receptors family 1 profile domain-containing protein n=1 Tax=Phaedon cochleariae TaxID=80249 RepID=A0A9N9SC96_PHACE|nr:unnamed protein product [Phaedon cochleariae]